jgi:hypothetical protein
MTNQLGIKELGHWKFSNRFNHNDYFGFLYAIENTVTNQWYIGKKNFFIRGKRSSKLYGKEHSWRTYTGSSVALNKDIKKYGKDKFNFMIIDLYKTKGGLYYAEAYSQMLLEVMTRYLPDGKTPQFYNRQISAIRFVPREDISNKTRRFITKLQRGLNG